MTVFEDNEDTLKLQRNIDQLGMGYEISTRKTQYDAADKKTD